MTRWSPGVDPLATAQASAIESAALIEESDLAPLLTRGRARLLAMPSRRYAGSSRCAARFAHLWGCSLEQAASEFGFEVAQVARRWRELYPDEPADPAQRGGR